MGFLMLFLSHVGWDSVWKIDTIFKYKCPIHLVWIWLACALHHSRGRLSNSMIILFHSSLNYMTSLTEFCVFLFQRIDVKICYKCEYPSTSILIFLKSWWKKPTICCFTWMNRYFFCLSAVENPSTISPHSDVASE